MRRTGGVRTSIPSARHAGPPAHLQGQVLVLRDAHVRRRGSRQRRRLRCGRAPGGHGAGGPPWHRPSRARPVAAGAEQRAAAAVAPRHSALGCGWRAHRCVSELVNSTAATSSACRLLLRRSRQRSASLDARSQRHAHWRAARECRYASVARALPLSKTPSAPPALGKAMQLRLVS